MDAEQRTAFAALLRGHRLAHGLTQEALAEAAGLSRDAIHLLERGERRSPRRETVTLLARALTLSGEEQSRLLAAAAAARTPPARGPASPSTLPVRLTSFVGREREIAELEVLLLAKRLVTLSGPGGIGKSSLALAVASALQPQFAGGVGLVELAALTDGELVPHAVATALGVRERPGELILTTVSRSLGTERRLLVLDNCEHLLLRCAQVAETLLRACPGLQILATSREPLRVAAEVIWRVPALSLPNEGIRSPSEISGSEAARLFVDRAGEVRPGFALTEMNAAAVGEICRRLDGIPLAIELAAARAGALPPEQIARHLNDRFSLLTSGTRTAWPRHRTLRALFDWSHDLLSETEQILFRRLAVFAGGWTLEAAEAVGQVTGDGCQVSGEDVPVPSPSSDTRHPSPDTNVLDLLLSLVDKSLVQVEERGGEARYRLLETLREYARQKLDQSGEARSAQAAHATYFATLVGGPGPQPVEEVIERLGALPLEAVADEADNLRAALSHFLKQAEAESGLGLAARIYHLWNLRGPREEGRDWLRRLLAMPASTPAPSRAAALFAAGWLATFQGDLAEAQATFGEAAALARSRGDRPGWAHAQTKLGVIALYRGETTRARAELEEAGRLAREGNSPVALVESLVHLGYLALAQGDLARAREAVGEGQAVLPRFPATAFRIRWLAGDLALAEGQGERAAREYRAGLAARWADGDPLGVALSALGLAEVAAAAREGARAARLLGGSEGLALSVGGREIPEPGPVRSAQHARVEAAGRELLGDEAFAAFRAEGRQLGLEEVARLALADQSSSPPSGG